MLHNKDMLETNVKTSMKFVNISRLIKFILFLIVITTYYFKSEWIVEVLVVAVSLNLLLPMNFFDTFIQKLLEYNTQSLEDRIILNANETNEYLKENDEFKNQIDIRLEKLENN